jgi:pilus assembly protein Flp/PilA
MAAGRKAPAIFSDPCSPVVSPVFALSPDHGDHAQETIMPKGIRRAVRNFLVNEDGPTAVEYAVMLALIIVVCIAAIRVLGTNASSTFRAVGSAIAGS